MPLLPEPILSRDSSLLLVKIGEPSSNDLRLILVEAKPQSTVVVTELGLANPIEPDQTSRGFELTWWRYVAYSVRNESYFSREDGADFSPGLIGTATNSAYLAYVRATTFASNDYPGPLTHWFVNTEWHCVDVISDTPPEIRELTPEQTARALEGYESGPLLRR